MEEEAQEERGDTLVGECHGGPLDRKMGASRFPKGFLLVDKQANLAWIYDWNGNAFICRDSMEGRTVDFDRRMDAAESPEWDVIAFASGGAS